MLPINKYVVIVARHSGLTFDVQDRGGEYAPVQTCGHGGQDNREFIIQPAEGDYYTISARHSGLSLEVRDRGGDYAMVQTCGHGGQENRQWRFIQQPNGCYNIVARHSGKGMDIRDARGEWSLVQTAGCGGEANSEFAIIPVAQYNQQPTMISTFLFKAVHLSNEQINRICRQNAFKDPHLTDAEREDACNRCEKIGWTNAILGGLGGTAVVGGPAGVAIGMAAGAAGGVYNSFLDEGECYKCVNAMAAATCAAQPPPDNAGPDKSDGSNYIREHMGPEIGHEIAPADGRTDLHNDIGADHIA